MIDHVGTKVSPFRTMGASSHSQTEREKDDFYATDPKAVKRLLEVEKFNNVIWENAVGMWHIADVLSEAGHEVIGTDLVVRDSRTYQLDFLANPKRPIDESFDIVSNPPYKFATEWVEKSMETLEEDCKLALLLKLTFLEGQKRAELFKKYPPKRVHVFSKRVHCAIGGNFENTYSSAICYCWFIWEKGFQGQPEIHWI